MSQRNSKSTLSGFTLAELLVVALVFTLVSGVAITTYTMLNRTMKEGLVLQELCHNANVAVEKMTRGRPENTGLLAASSVDHPAAGASDSRVDYTDVNGAARRFYLLNGRILALDGTVMLSDVSSVTFTHVDHMVRIGMVLQRRVFDRNIIFSFETQVYPRN